MAKTISKKGLSAAEFVHAQEELNVGGRVYNTLLLE